MILNSYIITYIVCSLVSLLLGLTAVVNGIFALIKWDITKNADDQYRLEKRVYFVITALCLSFFMRIFMVFLWFFALNSMIISIPGAMCLVGVHNVSVPLSYVATAMKLVLPSLYGYWLVLNYLDRQVPSQPFLKQKLFFIAPLGILMITEAALDMSFFFSAPPRQVSCCTSLFDIPGEDVVNIISGSSWIWVISFYILSLLLISQVIYFFFFQKKSSAHEKKWFGNKYLLIASTGLISLVIGTFIFALQTKISPLFLELPFHHCIFCLLQEETDALISFLLIFMGLNLALIYFWTISSSKYREVNNILSKHVMILLKWSVILFAGGILILSVRLAISI